jgi:hypothetical protein
MIMLLGCPIEACSILRRSATVNQNGRSGAKATPPRHIDANLINDAFGDGCPLARH